MQVEEMVRKRGREGEAATPQHFLPVPLSPFILFSIYPFTLFSVTPSSQSSSFITEHKWPDVLHCERSGGIK
jgi:hypothetical protein